jgi:hypothetical protein
MQGKYHRIIRFMISYRIQGFVGMYIPWGILPAKQSLLSGSMKTLSFESVLNVIIKLLFELYRENRSISGEA